MACAPGTFNATDGNEPCTPALPGFFVDVEGAVQASPCPLGRYQPAFGQTECRIAEIGSYVDQVAATQSTTCPAGTATFAAGATSPADCVPEAVETGVCTAGIGSLDYDPGILLGDPDGPVAQQTTVTMELSGCTSSAVAGSFTGTYTGSGDTVPLYVNGETDNSFLTLPIGTTVSVDSGSIAWSDGATSQAESELVLVADPVVGRAYELRWSITSGRFSGTSPVGSLGTADILDVPTLTYTGAELTLGAVVFVPLGGCAAPAAPNVDWRNCDKTGADLSGANLSGAILSGANLASADLSGADLSGADLSGAILWAADLSGADLSGADLLFVNLSGANLPARTCPAPTWPLPTCPAPTWPWPTCSAPPACRSTTWPSTPSRPAPMGPKLRHRRPASSLQLSSRRAYVDATGAAAATPEPTGCTSTVSVGEVAPGSRCRPLRGRDGGGWPEGTWSWRHRGDQPGLRGVGPRRGLPRSGTALMSEIVAPPLPRAWEAIRPTGPGQPQETTRRTALGDGPLGRCNPGRSHSVQCWIPRDEQVSGSMPLSGSNAGIICGSRCGQMVSPQCSTANPSSAANAPTAPRPPMKALPGCPGVASNSSISSSSSWTAAPDAPPISAGSPAARVST